MGLSADAVIKALRLSDHTPDGLGSLVSKITKVKDRSLVDEVVSAVTNRKGELHGDFTHIGPEHFKTLRSHAADLAAKEVHAAVPGTWGKIWGGAKVGGKGLLASAEVAGKGMKGARNGALLGAGIVALGSYLAFSNRGKKFEPDLQPVPPMPPLMTPQDLMAQTSMMNTSAVGPAEGYQPNQWQQYVQGGRQQGLGQSMEQQAAGQPRMSAMGEGDVDSLNLPSRA